MRRQGLPVGVLLPAAYNDDPFIMAVLQSGANGYMLMTAAPQDLIQAVRDGLGGRSALVRLITQKVMANIFQRPNPLFFEELT